MPTFHRITQGPSRATDSYGSGQFGASRTGHTHEGLDIVAKPAETIYSPIDGEVIRQAIPYPNDPRYVGVVISGTGDFEGYEVKMFYVQGFLSGKVRAGEPIGQAQDLGPRYPGITNHVHIEVRRSGVLLSPQDLYQMCF